MELFKLFGTIAINNQDANSAINETMGHAESGQERMTSAFAKIGTAVATYFTATKIIEFGKSCINAASDVEEMQNKFNVVFGDLSTTVDQWATDYASSIGRNSNSIKTYLADNQNMLVGMGATREEGANLSEQLVSLALDLASFNNLSEPDAVNALSKAMMGETESAKILGAVLNDNTRAQAMLDLGYQGTYDSLTEVQKMEVNYQAILNQSQDAIGDCERSMGSYKSTTIELTSAKEKLQETIGAMLLPTITKLAEAATDGIRTIQSVVEWLGSGSTSAEAFKTVLEGVAIAWGAWTVGTTIQSIVQGFQTAQVTLALYKASMEGASIAQGLFNGQLTLGETVVGLFTGQVTLAQLAEGGLAAAQGVLNAVMAANPIALVVAAIVALIAIFVLLWNKCDGFREFWLNLWEGIKQVAGVAFEAIQAAVGSFIEGVTAFFQGLHDNLKGIWDTICNVIQVAVMLIAEIFTAAFELLMAPWLFIWNNFSDEIIAAWEKFKQIISDALNAISTTIQNIWNAIVAFLQPILQSIANTFTSIWNSISSAISTVLAAIQSKISSIWNAISGTISSVMNSIRSTVSSIWNSISSSISSVVNTVKSVVSSAFSTIYSTISSKLNQAFSTVSNIFNNIRNTISSVINGAASIVGGAIDRIKGFFNFSWSLPHLQMPHPTISGSFSLNPPSVPHFGIDWYAKGAVLTEPTIFGMNPKTGNAQVGGEAGDEAVAPIETLMGYIRTAVGERNAELAQRLDRMIDLMTEFFPNVLAAMNRALVLDSGTLVGELAPAMDEALGELYDRKGRG